MRTHHPLRNIALTCLMAGTLATASAIAQTPAAAPPAPAVAAAPAADAPKPPTAEELAARVADLEQYFNNLAPSADGKLNGLAGSGSQRLSHDLRGAGAVHDAAGPGSLLRRPGPLEERPQRARAMPRHRGPGDHPVVLRAVTRSSSASIRLKALPRGRPSSAAPNTSSSKESAQRRMATTRGWPSQSTFAMYQLMFAIITPALIVGAIAERMKFSAVMLFVAIWMFVVYFPLAHMVWGFDGLHEWRLEWRRQDPRDRLRRRHGRPHELRLERARPLLDARQARRLRQGKDGAALDGPRHGRHRHALGRLVWIQCGLGARRRRHRLPRFHDHHARGGHRHLRVGRWSKRSTRASLPSSASAPVPSPAWW